MKFEKREKLLSLSCSIAYCNDLEIKINELANHPTLKTLSQCVELIRHIRAINITAYDSIR